MLDTITLDSERCLGHRKLLNRFSSTAGVGGTHILRNGLKLLSCVIMISGFKSPRM